jgi:hypothetical protein
MGYMAPQPNQKEARGMSPSFFVRLLMLCANRSTKKINTLIEKVLFSFYYAS